MNRRGPRSAVILAACVAVAVAGVMVGPGRAMLHRTGPKREARAQHGTAQLRLEGARAFHFDTLAEMVATSTVVVRGNVVQTVRGSVIDDGEVTYTRKRHVIHVAETLAGRPVEGDVAVETAGWQQIDGEAEVELASAGDVPLREGDDGVFFLYDFEHNGTYGFIDDQGVLLADGTQIQDSSRSDPLVAALEKKTVAEITTSVAAASAAVRRGEVTAHPYPGTAG